MLVDSETRSRILFAEVNEKQEEMAVDALMVDGAVAERAGQAIVAWELARDLGIPMERCLALLEEHPETSRVRSSPAVIYVSQAQPLSPTPEGVVEARRFRQWFLDELARGAREDFEANMRRGLAGKRRKKRIAIAKF